MGGDRESVPLRKDFDRLRPTAATLAHFEVTVSGGYRRTTG
jgi:hypothetical protein